MAKSFLTSYLEGENLGELSAMEQDGDIRHLGRVGRNVQLIGIYERTQAENEARDRRYEIEAAQRQAEESRIQDELRAEREADDRQRAAYLTSLRNAPAAVRHEAMPDSDEAVDDFLSSF